MGCAFTLLNFSALSENPIVDELEVSLFGYASRYWKGSWIDCVVDYLGPSMDFALSFLANTLELT